MKRFLIIFCCAVFLQCAISCSGTGQSGSARISSDDLIYRIGHLGNGTEVAEQLEYIADLGATAILVPSVSFKQKGSENLEIIAAAADSSGLKVILELDAGYSSPSSEGTRSNEMVSRQNDLYGSSGEVSSFLLPAAEMDSLKRWCSDCIEKAGADGVCFSGYPFAAKEQMAQLNSHLRKEFGNIFILGEIQSENIAQLAYWQADDSNRDGFNSRLSSLMDFRLYDAVCKAINVDKEYKGEGISRVFSVLADDFCYDNPESLVIFSGTDGCKNIKDVCGGDERKVKTVITMVATLRGIPQLFEGDEILSGEDIDYCRQLFNWRKTSNAVRGGKTIHFASGQNTYSYFRYTENEAVFVFVNNNAEPRVIPWHTFEAFTSAYQGAWTDAFTGKEVNPSAYFVPAKGTALFQLVF